MDELVKRIDAILEDTRELIERIKTENLSICDKYTPNDFLSIGPFPSISYDIRLEIHAMQFITSCFQNSLSNIKIDKNEAKTYFSKNQPFRAHAYLQYLKETYGDQSQIAHKQIIQSVLEMIPYIPDGKTWRGKHVKYPSDWPRRGKSTITVRTRDNDDCSSQYYLKQFCRYCNIVLNNANPADAESICPQIIEIKTFQNGNANVKFINNRDVETIIVSILNEARECCSEQM